MAQNESVKFFLRLLNERFVLFQQRFDAVVQAMASQNPEQTVTACRAATESLNELKRTLSKNDHPAWIEPVESTMQVYTERPGYPNAGHELMKAIIAYSSAIKGQAWHFANATGMEPVDFDSVYQRYYQESRLPDLFQELVAQLQRVIDSGEIDSLKSIRALEKMIATIKKNIRGSYFSTAGTWDFTVLFFKNYLWEQLSGIPGLGSALKALRKTMDDLDSEMARVHDEMRKELSSQVNADLPMLDYRSKSLPEPPKTF